MGRYDGEDYDDGPLCEPTKHNFAMNGLCSRCGRTRAHLINYAKATLKALEYKPKKRSAYEPRGLRRAMDLEIEDQAGWKKKSPYEPIGAKGLKL